ncbi:hypothetical protein HY623_03160 [Candidatus Uhrbacteria bacterium]|nr:hypothetical protein [Candidatus Uhrbacteria bacterium]
MRTKRPPTFLRVNARCTAYGIDIILNDDVFPIRYPAQVWRRYPTRSKKLLMDALALSATYFVPQIVNVPTIHYLTRRSFAEPYLFKNGLYDMATTAHSDKQSSTAYIKNYINVSRCFSSDPMILPAIGRERKQSPVAVIPFTFGKETLLTLALALEAGMKPILVAVREPAHTYEFHHKKNLARTFTKETDIPIFFIDYLPGIMRYGALWNKQTELGWGLQTTEYAMLCAPFISYYSASYLCIGNEHSCDTSDIDSEGVITHWSGYDQHHEWTPHQSTVVSLLCGSPVTVASFVESLNELAEMLVLHRRFPALGAYQTSCLGINASARAKRWCERCQKCACMYLFCRVVGRDPAELGFTKNLLDKNHASLFSGFFTVKEDDEFYGLIEEVETALLSLYRRGDRDHTIVAFSSSLSGADVRRIEKQAHAMFTIHPPSTLPQTLYKKFHPLFAKELGHAYEELIRIP